MDPTALKRLAGQLIAAGAPTLGQLIGDLLPLPIPGKSSLITWALQQAAAQLGAAAETPEAISAAIEATPAATAAERLAPVESAISAEVERIRAQAEVAKTALAEVNASIRAEAATRDGWWGTWRTILAYELALECPAWAALMMWAIVAGRIADLVAAASILTVWWGARFGVLGVHVWTGSNERQTAITGQPIPGVVGAVVGAVKRGGR